MPSSAPPKVEEAQEGRGPCPEVHKRYPKGKGDIVLVSSDNVRFYVRSMYLAAASRVWRDMLEIPLAQATVRPVVTCLQVQEIVLTDRDLEASQILEILMDTIHGHTLPAPTNVNLGRLQNAVGLARKYDCAAALQLFHHAIRGYTLNTTWPHQLFVLAALFDDIEACEYIIKHSGHRYFIYPKNYYEHNQTRLVHFVPKAFVFQVAAWPMNIAKAIQFKYMFALLRAEFESKGDAATNTAKKWETVASRFRELMGE